MFWNVQTKKCGESDICNTVECESRNSPRYSGVFEWQVLCLFMADQCLLNFGGLGLRLSESQTSTGPRSDALCIASGTEVLADPHVYLPTVRPQTSQQTTFLPYRSPISCSSRTFQQRQLGNQPWCGCRYSQPEYQGGGSAGGGLRGQKHTIKSTNFKTGRACPLREWGFSRVPESISLSGQGAGATSDDKSIWSSP